MKERIMAATMEEVNIHGLKFTMNDLAKRLKISKRSLYENFPSKQDLIDSILTILLSNLEKQEKEIYQTQMPIIDKLKALLSILPYEAETFDKHIYEDLKTTFPEQWKKVELSRKIRMERIEKVLKVGIDAGIIRNINIYVLQEILKTSFDAFTTYRFLNSNNLTYKDAINAMLDILIHGLLTGNKK